ncbi:MAG: RNA methyltransferase [Alphaproteobacteria bacterium]|nr:RNA methyltransferase [Alphaproteobacteria bacterium]
MSERRGPAIVLVEPQMGENIGATARAMLNFGLTDLRLVRPRDGWPNIKAIAAAVGATAVLDRIRVHDSLDEAIGDCVTVFATTARPREMLKPTYTLRRAAAEMRAVADRGVALVFGPERTGLTNDDVAIADALVTVPTSTEFSSINLAQTVLLAAYEWFLAGDATTEVRLDPGQTRPATRAEVLNFFAHLERELDQTPFLANKQQRPSMIRNLRTLFLRAQPFEQELRTLHGVIAELGRRRES